MDRGALRQYFVWWETGAYSDFWIGHDKKSADSGKRKRQKVGAVPTRSGEKFEKIAMKMHKNGWNNLNKIALNFQFKQEMQKFLIFSRLRAFLKLPILACFRFYLLTVYFFTLIHFHCLVPQQGEK